MDNWEFVEVKDIRSEDSIASLSSRLFFIISYNPFFLKRFWKWYDIKIIFKINLDKIFYKILHEMMQDLM